MKEELLQKTTTHFEVRFNAPPQAIFLSPGRINIIGEHVDYNDGFVLPAAIDKYICFAITSLETDECVLVAEDLDEEYSFSLTDELIPVKPMWANFILGGLHQLKQKGLKLKGFQLVFSSTIPIGAGLSSSAALECGLIYAMNNLFSLELSKQTIALMGQQTSHSFVGVKCGIMDQFACVFGKKDSALKLDCTSLDYSYFDADLGSYSLLLLDSHVKHEHLTSGYNVRREEVETGLNIIKVQYPEVSSFRSCTLSQVNSLRKELGENLFKRCSFVVKEIQRVNEAAYSIQNKDYKTLGKLMLETHDGLSRDYEVSCEELDFLVNKASAVPGVLGARMMGGGFGGCSINLVRKKSIDPLIENLSAAYFEKFKIDLSAYQIQISDGIHQVK
ncbi:galactokinase [Psychroflexus sp. YR1-1]|uniref:Galactokinase n=2 Tax=Psychroflexus aurantiacus TaxID=2709310 RepID=A0A6B3R7V8_9FLAO|nr:galactokinase [Psychroflexus aurantiacus]